MIEKSLPLKELCHKQWYNIAQDLLVAKEGANKIPTFYFLTDKGKKVLCGIEWVIKFKFAA
jgi:hypothetical protein